MNTCQFSGNLVRDPESRMLGDASKVVNFSLAVNRRPYKDKNTGEWVREADFFDFEAWNKQAEYIENHLQKGNKVIVAGTARLHQWSDKEGQKRSKVVFRVENIENITYKPKEDNPVGDGEANIPF